MGDVEQSERRGEEKRRHTARQPLVPLAVLAAALTAVGYYVALTEEPEAAAGADRPEAVGQTEPIAIDPSRIDRDVEAVNLGYEAAPARSLELFMSQTTRRRDEAGEEKRLETDIDLRIEEAIDERPASGGRTRHLAIDRTYEDIVTDIEGADGESTASDISKHVQGLVSGSMTRSLISFEGEPIDFEWRGVSNPHSRRTLSVMRNAHDLLTPRYMTGPVNPDDTWSYEQPVSVEASDANLSASGSIDVESRFLGMTEDEGATRAVVRQRFTMAIDGEAEGEGDEPTGFRSEGAGRADFLVDVETGRPHKADLTFDRTLTVQQQEGKPQVQASHMLVALRPAE